MVYLGDIAEDASVTFFWNTNDSNGASVTRATDGTIKVLRDDGTDATGTSVTDSEDTPDTGIHKCVVDTSDNANFAVGYDYVVWVDGAVIDSQTVNAALAHFSIENRFQEVDVVKIGGAAQSATDLKDFADSGYDPSTHRAYADLKAVDSDATVVTNLKAKYGANWRKHIWHVAKSGNDSNEGHCLNDAFLTIGQAVTDAVDGDMIVIWPGTYAEAVDLDTANKGLYLKARSGYGSVTISPATGTAVTLEDGTTLEDLICIAQAGSSARGIDGGGKNDVILKNVYAESESTSGAVDGLVATNTKRWFIENLTAKSPYDGATIGGAQSLFGRNVTCITTAGMGATNCYGLKMATNGSAVFNALTLLATRSAGDGDTIGGQLHSNVVVRGLTSYVEVTGGAGDAKAVVTSSGGYGIPSIVAGSAKALVNGGSGSMYDIDAGSGSVVISGISYDATKTNGTLHIQSPELSQAIRDAMKLAPAAGSPAAGSVDKHLDDILTYAVSAAAWGSINSGAIFRGTVTADDPGVSFTIAGLAGQGAGAFVDANTPWYAYVFRDAGGGAAAPQGEVRKVTAYTTATGLFTTDAFSASVATGDNVMIVSAALINSLAIKTRVELALPNAAPDAPGGLPTSDAIASDVLAGLIEGTITLQQAQRLMLSALTGKSSGGGTATNTFRDTEDGKNRIIATVTANGDRTAVTRDVS